MTAVAVIGPGSPSGTITSDNSFYPYIAIYMPLVTAYNASLWGGPFITEQLITRPIYPTGITNRFTNYEINSFVGQRMLSSILEQLSALANHIGQGAPELLEPPMEAFPETNLSKITSSPLGIGMISDPLLLIYEAGGVEALYPILKAKIAASVGLGIIPPLMPTQLGIFDNRSIPTMEIITLCQLSVMDRTLDILNAILKILGMTSTVVGMRYYQYVALVDASLLPRTLMNLHAVKPHAVTIPGMLGEGLSPYMSPIGVSGMRCESMDFTLGIMYMQIESIQQLFLAIATATGFSLVDPGWVHTLTKFPII